MKRTQRRPFPIVAHRGYWTLRPRVRIILNREEKIIQRAIRLCPVDEGHPTKDCQRVQDLASQKLSELGLLDKQSAPLTVSTLAAFVEPVYLKWVREHRRPSTADGYEKVWHGCLAPRPEIRDAWMACQGLRSRRRRLRDCVVANSAVLPGQTTDLRPTRIRLGCYMSRTTCGGATWENPKHASQRTLFR